jgi:hypothetical protein
MKELLFVEKIPVAYKSSNYYQRRTEFLGDLKSFINHAKEVRKNISLPDFILYYESKYGFSAKVIREF